MFWKCQFITIFVMDGFTPKQRAETVPLHIENSRSIVLTQRAYREKYRGKAKAPYDISPDLALQTFFCGVICKARLNANQPQTMNEIKTEIDVITLEMLGKLMANAEKMSHFVIANNGYLFMNDFVFKN
ncbi:unnamed protein product [Ceratitis capitata]|uniref:(Mediterranean fruit fly) hypothetical protein n=1 Tax=Ceratitis capitata TaxID=7213 RepID=A0A811UIJ7_CERCA|nr:unnamed protein product [Ceratitis capitata]